MIATIARGSEAVAWRPSRWVVPLFVLVASVLVPWIVVLAAHLPSKHASPHWDITWIGFDVVLSLFLFAVALAAWRRSPWLEGAATAAAALLAVDAWFDITTSASTAELTLALAEAVVVELPLAGLCLLLARDAERVLIGRSGGGGTTSRQGAGGGLRSRLRMRLLRR